MDTVQTGRKIDRNSIELHKVMPEGAKRVRQPSKAEETQLIKKIAMTVLAVGILTITSATYAAETSTYNGPKAGTVEGSASMNYMDSQYNKGNGSIKIAEYDLGVSYYVTEPIWVRARYRAIDVKVTGQPNDNMGLFDFAAAYSFMKGSNIQPYLGVGIMSISKDASGFDKSGTSVEGIIGVSDYFAKRTAVCLEETIYSQKEFGVTADRYDTLLGLKYDFN
jgi:uncharacterized protein (DUF779 family)